MRRLIPAVAGIVLALAAFAGPASARDFGAIYANDQVYRVFANPANVPDGTGTDPFATFRNSTNPAQRGVAQFAPGLTPGGSHGGRWAIYRVTWTAGDPATLVTSWGQLQALADTGRLTVVRDAAADFRCPVLGDPQPIA